MKEPRKKSMTELHEHWRILNQRTLKLEFASVIGGLLVRNSLTRDDLARLLGCEPSYVTKLLSGDENVSLHTVADVTLVLGASAHWLLSPLLRGDSNRVAPPSDQEPTAESA